MKQGPILFQTVMVQAILAGTKTQTRRIMKVQPAEVDNYDDIALLYTSTDEDRQEYTIGQPPFKCPYGEVGDVLWVRETFYGGYVYDDKTNKYSEELHYWHRADTLDARPGDVSDEWCINEFGAENKDMWPKWKPSIHMPYVAARLFLKITSIRVERILEISESDCVAEGVASVTARRINSDVSEPRYQDYLGRYDIEHPNHRWFHSAKASYESLWKKINGAESWAEDPYVWVVEFERVDPATL